MIDATGIRQLGARAWLVRVKRVDARTGRVANRRRRIAGTRADAVRARDELRAQLAAGAGRHERRRLCDFATAWLERRRPNLKPATLARYQIALAHIDRELGELYVDAITSADVESYLAARLRAGAAGYSVLNELRSLRTIARDTVAERLASSYWCDRIKPPKTSRYSTKKPNLLTPDQARRVLEHVPLRWRGLIVLLMTTGLRIGEATALRWDDLRVGEAEIARTNFKGAANDPKTEGSERTVPVLPEVLELLGPRRGELVFPVGQGARRGELHRGSPLRGVLTRACAAAGVPRVTTHGLRRTFNDAARRRGDRAVLKSITGHTTDEMTDHYSVIDGGEKAELAGDVAAAFGVRAVSDDRTTKGRKS